MKNVNVPQDFLGTNLPSIAILLVDLSNKELKENANVLRDIIEE